MERIVQSPGLAELLNSYTFEMICIPQKWKYHEHGQNINLWIVVKQKNWLMGRGGAFIYSLTGFPEPRLGLCNFSSLKINFILFCCIFTYHGCIYLKISKIVHENKIQIYHKKFLYWKKIFAASKILQAKFLHSMCPINLFARLLLVRIKKIRQCCRKTRNYRVIL